MQSCPKQARGAWGGAGVEFPASARAQMRVAAQFRRRKFSFFEGTLLVLVRGKLKEHRHFKDPSNLAAQVISRFMQPRVLESSGRFQKNLSTETFGSFLISDMPT